MPSAAARPARNIRRSLVHQRVRRRNAPRGAQEVTTRGTKGTAPSWSPAFPSRRPDMASSNSNEPSVAELRRDADRTRAHLTGTVEELRSQVADTATYVRDAVSPATIKRQVKDYVRGSSEDMLQSLQRRARENP